MPQPRVPNPPDAPRKARRAVEVIGLALLAIVTYSVSLALWVVFVRWCMA